MTAIVKRLVCYAPQIKCGYVRRQTRREGFLVSMCFDGSSTTTLDEETSSCAEIIVM